MASTLGPTTNPPVRADRGPRGRGFARAARQRLVSPMPDDGWLGWVGPLLVTALAALLRFTHLSSPRAFVFDEIYYPQEAHSYLKYGVEYAVPYHGQVENPPHPEFIAHPPLGKWVIAVGEWIFGYHPGSDGFGWRFSVALLGTLSVLVVARVGRRLFRSTLLGCVAGLLLALDGLAIVMSRTALLDGILAFFALCCFGCVVVDRDFIRARLARGLERRGGDVTGMLLLNRPWLLAAGVFAGASCATKWNGAFFLAAFGLLALVWTASARRAAGSNRAYLDTLTRDIPVLVVCFAIVPLAVYLASWTGWFLSDSYHACYRAWASPTQPASLSGTNYCLSDWAGEGANPYPWLPTEALKSLWYYHTKMYEFNVNLHTFHAYRSNPWTWLLQGRPVSFWYPTGASAPKDCGASTCTAPITALGTPALWWASIPALAVLLFRAFGRLDWRAGAILVGVGAGYLPWFDYQQRTIFESYAVVFVPYLALAVAMSLGLVLGGPNASPNRRTWGASLAGAYVLLVAANLAYLWPIFVGDHIPYAEWLRRMWFRSWI